MDPHNYNYRPYNDDYYYLSITRVSTTIGDTANRSDSHMWVHLRVRVRPPVPKRIKLKSTNAALLFTTVVINQTRSIFIRPHKPDRHFALSKTVS